MKTDIIVIGSGIAGLSFALKAGKYASIILVTKDNISESNTNYAQGGLAAVFSNDDSPELHLKDTIRAGDGLCNEDAVKVLVENAPREIRWLESQGVKFDKDNSHLALSKEAVHSKARIVHARDITGRKIEEVLVKNIKKNKRITVLEKHIAVDLITKNKKCIGASILDIKRNKALNIFSKAVVLATGGIGRLYKNTCNPPIATADGLSIAYRAEADLEDMEFVQFHPTGLYKSNPIFLISETLRGEGGILRNKYGEIYMENYHRDGGLAPRDVVSRFSVIEMKKTKSDHIFLDMTHLGKDYLKRRFPNIYKECLKYGIDMAKKPIPVCPTAHYICGGVKIDLDGKTNIKNLYTVGEASCSGLHGADRLASNSLTDGLVFGARLANYLEKSIKNKEISEIKINEKIIINKKSNKKTEILKSRLQNLMWDKVGIIRNRKGLNSAMKTIKRLEKQIKMIKKEGINKNIIELDNMVLVSKLIAASALKRKESRGTHFIEEFPDRDDKRWKKPSQVTISLSEEHGITYLDMLQENVPDGDRDKINKGWKDFYFGPLKNFLEGAQLDSR